MSYLSRLVARETLQHCLMRKSLPPFITPAHCRTLLIFRTATPSPLRKLFLGDAQSSPMSTSSGIRIRPVKREDCEPTLAQHDAYNKDIGRPLSPHIRIYRKQLTSLLSFAHRLTGIMMAFYIYTVVMGTWLWTDLTSFLDWIACWDISEDIWYALHRSLRFIMAYPICYHALNAVRHLGWDFGKLLSLKAIYSTGYLVQMLAIVATAALMLCSDMDW